MLYTMKTFHVIFQSIKSSSWLLNVWNMCYTKKKKPESCAFLHFCYTFTREMKVLKYKIMFYAMGIETLLWKKIE